MGQNETEPIEQDPDVQATVELMLNTKMVTDHLSLVIQDIRRHTQIQGLPLFVGLLAVAVQEANLMLATVEGYDKQVFLASQLATRLLTTGDVVMSMVKRPDDDRPQTV
jgi:hypothetical protein